MIEFAAPYRSWHPSIPDSRDYHPKGAPAREMLGRLKNGASAGSALPTSVDLREYFAPVGDQQGLNSGTAYACVALFEYFQRRALGEMGRGSVQFVYKMSRKLLRREGDSGSDVRTTLKAIARFGVPPAQYCPYDASRFDEEPDPFLYRLSAETRPIIYLRLDAPNGSGARTLDGIRAFLAAGFPCVFGFSLPSSLSQDGEVPWRPIHDSVLGGQSVVAVGYDDERIRATKGALLFRNSWGPLWGDGGYGWLPYRFFEQQMATDCWTLLRQDWLDSGEFIAPVAV